jgi:hypothetical protein
VSFERFRSAVGAQDALAVQQQQAGQVGDRVSEGM